MRASAFRRTFTFTSAVTGEKVTVTCMPGCTVDHEADSNTLEHPHDIYCNIPGTAGELPLYGPLCDTGRPEDFRFRSWQIESRPFSGRPAQRLPFVAIEVIDDHYIEYLDPDTLAMVISRLQEQVDALREAHTQLVNVRTAYLNPPEAAARRPRPSPKVPSQRWTRSAPRCGNSAPAPPAVERFADEVIVQIIVCGSPKAAVEAAIHNLPNEPAEVAVRRH
ncbi:DUF6907 domain-containing protein [Streptomyces europaeiscabiei]|uniref:DUF6907 domain-containing protein n=1 Tax=Streptomyces europaeiscabiei TaxID=146819 RepID=UPI0038D4EC5C